MARFIRRRDWETHYNYTLHFHRTDSSSSGYSFRCDKNGVVDKERLTEQGIENLRKCLSGEHSVHKPEVICREYEVVIPAIIECSCEAHVVLEDLWATQCQKCGAEYNGSGQRLAPRSEWGWETGESFD